MPSTSYSTNMSRKKSPVWPEWEHGVDEEDAEDDLPDSLHHLVQRALQALTPALQAERHWKNTD